MAVGADAVTGEVVAWTRARLPGLSVEALGAADRAGTEGVEVRLLNVASRPEPASPERRVTLALDYLVTVRLADAEAEHRAVGELFFAALDRADVEVVADRSALEACGALGLPPALGIVLRVAMARERPTRRVQLVREPLVARVVPLGRVEGLVLGPGDVPIAGATVTLIGLDRSARTGADGRFELPGPLPETAPVRVAARARGVEIEMVAAAGDPVVLKLPLEV